jgi:superfamily I DNA/RNA helicase
MLKYQQRFQYILVDEYQDTNLAQYNIVRTLAARHENITVVGDDSQSIYAFRGANIQNILNFRRDYPDFTKSSSWSRTTAARRTSWRREQPDRQEQGALRENDLDGERRRARASA